LTAERVGIAVFSKELLSNRFNITSELRTFNENNRRVISDYLRQRTNVYSTAIQDSITFQQTLPNFSNRNVRRFAILAEEIEEKILKGSVSVDENGNIFYQFQNTKISIQEAASTIKSLSSLVLFLKYNASKWSVLFFDEPEINLHPDNQRILARIISKMVNYGIKVFVSTHSDYIIRELNNLILLKAHKDSSLSNELMARYQYDSDEIIDPQKIAVYTFDKFHDDQVIVNHRELTTEGININSINQIINNQNIASNDIYFSLVERESEN
jgi:predicted ATPase